MALFRRIPRPDALAGYLSESLWLLPSLAVTSGIFGASLLAVVRGGPPLFVSGTDSARQILITIAGAGITVTGTVFSLSIVVLEMASSQYSPRLLRNFLADRGTQTTLSIFLGTVAYCLSLLRALPRGSDNAAFPQWAVAGAFVLVLASLAALVYYMHHISQSIRVESILADVEQRTLATIRSRYPETDTVGVAAMPPVPEAAVRVPVDESGFLQAVDLTQLLVVAQHHDLVVRLRPLVGEHVVAGTTLAWVWRTDGGELDAARLSEPFNDLVEISFERTLAQDVAFGVRQLVDIAIRAISPAVNDPTTAVDAISHLAVLLSALAGREIGPRLLADADGRVRVALDSCDFADYLGAACDQIRRFGAKEPAVLVALLGLLTDTACRARDDERRKAVADQIALLTTDAEREIVQPADLNGVAAAAELARRAARGDLPERIAGSGP
ncbi:MAG: DUF2254 domain-containing protein [Euzebyaceae bacterium]|jgi:uncharacterized membrane protein|nr:DUF2254 domain-containing protein [Euzebyaceae bacterium]